MKRLIDRNVRFVMVTGGVVVDEPAHEPIVRTVGHVQYSAGAPGRTPEERYAAAFGHPPLEDPDGDDWHAWPPPADTEKEPSR